MTGKEILKLEAEIVDKDLFQQIFESEDVMNFQNCGMSGLKKGCCWYIVTLIDGTEVNIYSVE